MDKHSRIFVAGHLGLVGSAIQRKLEAAGHTNLIVRTRAELDLTNQAAVDGFFRAERPEYVFLAAAKVGGILANSTCPADFLRENLLIQAHVIDAAYRHGVSKLQFHEAARAGVPEVTVWGTGAPRRELLHVDDFAGAAVFLMLNYNEEVIINVGTGEDVTIRELAELIRGVSGYGGRLAFDPSKPDGTPRKQLDVSRLQALGWRARIPLQQGLRDTYQWFVASGQ